MLPMLGGLRSEYDWVILIVVLFALGWYFYKRTV